MFIFQELPNHQGIPSKTNSTYNVELGTESPQIEKAFFFEDKSEAFVNDVEMDASEVDFEKTGTYTVYFSRTIKPFNFVQNAEGMVVVEDTTEPEFENFVETIKIEQNAQDVVMEQYFSVKDASEVTIEIKGDEIDFSKVGTYAIEVEATDTSKNSTKQKGEVEIVATKNINTKTIGELTPYANTGDEDNTTDATKSLLFKPYKNMENYTAFKITNL